MMDLHLQFKQLGQLIKLSFMKLFLIFVVGFLGSQIYAQTPTMSWQKTIGGSDSDIANTVVQLSNGDYVICAASFSNVSGEKSEIGFGALDIWVYQIEQSGNIVWQKTYGGSENDVPMSILQTPDGGFLVSGISKSPISGNKTAMHFGEDDLWLLKLGSNGAVQWQKSYGGNSFENRGGKILALNDGSYILSVSSSSDVTGNKTIASKGGSDYWVLHIDSLGSILNQFVYGGDNNDFINTVSLFSNNRLAISGWSNSNLSGDKLENSFGSFDYWVIITDLNGVVLKSTTLGGDDMEINSGLIISASKELILFGTSKSGVSGNKSSGNNGWGDYWLIKVDSNLDIKWDANFGGDFVEEVGVGPGLFFNDSNTIIYGGLSESGISGNKSLPSFGDKDIWLVGMDLNGSKLFEFVAGGSDQETYGQIIETIDNTILVAGGSWSGISGNKNEASRGLFDVWQFELDFNVGVKKVYANNEISAYPIPATTILNFSIPMKGTATQISLTDAMGKVVYLGSNVFGEDEQIDVSALPSGIYILNVNSEEFYYTRKIVIE